MSTLDQRQQARRKHPHSVFFKPSTGEVEAYPLGHIRQVLEDCQYLKLNGFQEAVEVVRTSTGSTRHQSIDDSAGGLTALRRVLDRKRDGGKPAFMLKGEWDQLSTADRKALVVNPSAADTKTREPKS